MLPGKLPNLALLSQAILVIAAANAQPADPTAAPAPALPAAETPAARPPERDADQPAFSAPTP